MRVPYVLRISKSARRVHKLASGRARSRLPRFLNANRSSGSPASPRRAAALAAILMLGACARGAHDYYPLDAGRWWYYEISEAVLDEPQASRYILRNLGQRLLGQEHVFVQRAQNATTALYARRGHGVVRIAQKHRFTPTQILDQPPRIVLPAKLELNARWTVPSSLGVIESRTFARGDRIIPRNHRVDIEKTLVAVDARISVPAGEFGNCLLIAGHGATEVTTDRGNSTASVTVETREWYAPDVGLVKLERTEASASTFLKTGHQRWELADYGQ